MSDRDKGTANFVLKAGELEASKGTRKLSTLKKVKANGISELGTQKESWMKFFGPVTLATVCSSAGLKAVELNLGI